jgi:hypothetical protein
MKEEDIVSNTLGELKWLQQTLATDCRYCGQDVIGIRSHRPHWSLTTLSDNSSESILDPTHAEESIQDDAMSAI